MKNIIKDVYDDNNRLENTLMKYALIGCGRIAKNHLIAAKNNSFEIIAICDLVPNKMDRILTVNGIDDTSSIKKYTNYKIMVDELKPDLISIATESGRHAEIAMYCINKGCNVIIEKPMTLNLKDADKIIELSEINNVKVSVCHQNRFNLAIKQLRRAIDLGRFGRLSHGAINVRWNRSKGYYEQASWRGTWEQDGGALMNQCIHGIDLLRWMLGEEIDEVYGQTRKQFHTYLPVEDLGVAVIKFKNGIVGTIEGTTNIYPENLEETLYIFGEKGTVKIGGLSANNIDLWHFKDFDQYDENVKLLKESTSNVYGNGHTSLFADMYDSIINDRNPLVDAYAGRRAVELVLAIYKSQKEGLPVKLPLKDFSTIDMLVDEKDVQYEKN